MQNLNCFLVVCAMAASVCVAPMGHAQDNEAQAKAREVLRKQINEAPPVAVPQPMSISQPASKPAPVMITMAPAVAPSVAAPDAQVIEKARQAVRQQLGQPDSGSPDSPEIAKAREATRRKLAESHQPEPAQLEADKAESAAKAERHGKRNANLSPKAFQPIESPALPVSNEKQQRLTELLQKYRADQVTPEQYHLERVKILAEP